MRRLHSSIVCALLVASAGEALANPVFVNGLRFRGSRTDVTGDPSPNGGRLGFFSDLYYDPIREEWWALGDRGPGGGVLDYQTRVQRIALDVDPWTGRISRFRVLKTVQFTDPFGLLSAPDSALPIARKRALNGLNPLLLNSDAAELGRSFDPEGLVIDPKTGHFLVSDEYGPSLYEFDRKGRLIFVFETPANLVPRLNGTANYVAVRDDCASAEHLPRSPGQPRLRRARDHSRRQEALRRAPGPARRGAAGARRAQRPQRADRGVRQRPDEPELRHERRAVRLPARAPGARSATGSWRFP